MKNLTTTVYYRPSFDPQKAQYFAWATLELPQSGQKLPWFILASWGLSFTISGVFSFINSSSDVSIDLIVDSGLIWFKSSFNTSNFVISVFNNLKYKGVHERVEMVKRLRSLQAKGVAPLETLWVLWYPETD